MTRLKSLFLVMMLLSHSALALAFDQSHAAWSALLQAHVVLTAHGNASRVRYADMKADQARLNGYLNQLSAVSQPEFQSWSKPQRMAFLINAYNAFTVDLILTKYPRLASIKDLGNFFQSPWKKKFFFLLGRRRSLDDIEHGMLLARGAFDDPRVHFALVCASIGCPMLRPQAYTADRLDAQLDDQMRRFLSDHARNRFDDATGRLQVSKIFDWYGKDFEQGYLGFDSLKTTFARYAEQLASSPDGVKRIRAGTYTLEFLDYDWRLNDAGR